MASFEVVVRPAVLPNIRPAPKQSLPPQDDPEKGFAVIRGNGAKQVDLSNSWSVSASTSNRKEEKRRVDTARVYQKEEDGTINRDNFVDIEIPNKVWMKGPQSSRPSDTNTRNDSIGVRNDSIGVQNELWNFQRVKEKDNVEIKDRDKMVYPDR
jgi:hypothetical protein